MLLNVCLAGATGCAGSELARAIARTADLALVAGVARKHAGRILGDVLGEPRLTGQVCASAAEALASRCDVLVLTRHARAPLRMRGGTKIHFVTDGIYAALQPARDAAGGLGIWAFGVVSTIRQHLQAALLDGLQLTLAPVLLATGEFIVPIFGRFR